MNKSLRKKIKSMYNTCFYCGKQLSDKEKTVDHIHPQSEGGLDTEENLVVSCTPCNSKKGSMSIKEFIYYLEHEKEINRNTRLDEFTRKLNLINPSLRHTQIKINDIVFFRFYVPTKGKKYNSALKYFNEKKEFHKDVMVIKIRNKYLLLNGYSVLEISQDLGYTDIPVVLIEDNDWVPSKKLIKRIQF